MIRGFIAWNSMMRIKSQRYKGLAETIGLCLLLKGTHGDLFKFMVKCGLSCSYKRCIEILTKRKNVAIDQVSA